MRSRTSTDITVWMSDIEELQKFGEIRNDFCKIVCPEIQKQKREQRDIEREKKKK